MYYFQNLTIIKNAKQTNNTTHTHPKCLSNSYDILKLVKKNFKDNFLIDSYHRHDRFASDSIDYSYTSL